MKSFLYVAAVLLGGCAAFGQPASTAMQPPLAGNYCSAPVAGACIGCDVTCPPYVHASCRAGVSTARTDNSAGMCTKAPVCECR
jgi:hypothetical protein